MQYDILTSVNDYGLKNIFVIIAYIDLHMIYYTRKIHRVVAARRVYLRAPSSTAAWMRSRRAASYTYVNVKENDEQSCLIAARGTL